MKIRVPPKRIREEFILTCELKGSQKGINLLSEHYGIKRMRVILDGRRVGKGDLACYQNNKARAFQTVLLQNNVLPLNLALNKLLGNLKRPSILQSIILA